MRSIHAWVSGGDIVHVRAGVSLELTEGSDNGFVLSSGRVNDRSM